MKKNIIVSLFAVTLLLMYTACEDGKGEYLDDYSTILYFRDSGEIPITIYQTGEDADYTLTVNKSGSRLDAVTEVSISMMDSESLDRYNTEEFTSYKAIPADCYEITGGMKLDFGPSDLYKQVHVKLKTELIHALAPIGEKEVYVIPLQLSNSVDSINSTKDIVFIKPTVLVPSVGFSQTGYVPTIFSDAGASQEVFTLPVELSLQSKWVFNCGIAVDEKLLDDYNKANETDYALLPATAYTLNNPVAFKADSATSADLKINVDRTGLSYGNYVIPLQLATCSKPEFVVDTLRNTCLYGISYVPDESKLVKVPLTVDMISSNSPAAEGSLDDLLDGDATTYFHSDYSGEVAPPHYLQVNLPEAKSAYSFSFTARSSQGNGTPAEMEIAGSMDGTTFHKIGVITEGFPATGSAGGGQSYTSPVMVGKSFKYIRFYVNKNQAGDVYFALSEFGLKVL